MSLFSSIGRFISKGSSNVAQTFTTIAANTLSVVPIVRNTSFVSQNKSSFTSPIPLAATIAEHPFSTAALVAGVANPSGAFAAVKAGISALPAAVSTIAKNIKTVVGLGAAVAITDVATKANPNLPTQTAGLVKDAVNTAGTAIGDASSGNYVGALKDLGEFAKTHPIATAGVAIGGVIAGSGLISTIINAENTKAVKDNTAATISSIDTSSPQPSQPNVVYYLPTPANTSTTPLAAGATVSTKPKKKKKKKKAKSLNKPKKKKKKKKKK
jgi:hypothetical protein